MRSLCIRALLLSSLVIGVGCEPIAAPPPEQDELAAARLEPGDRLPQFHLRDHNGEPLTPASLLGSVATLTFVAPGTTTPELFLQRVDDVYDRLGDEATEIERYIVTLPTPGLSPSALVERAGWQSLRGDPDATIDLARRFGVMAWLGSDGTPVQNVSIAVIRPDGVIAARLGGVETWQEMDLLVAITEAGR